MLLIKDQTGNTIKLRQTPQRIISLVPSQTELLYYLGLNKEVVGITKFCVHPQEWFKNKKRVGGTKQLHLKDIQKLNPDLIIANKEENSKQDIEMLMHYYKNKVWISDIQTINDALSMIQQIGLLVNKQDAAQKLICTVQQKLSTILLQTQQYTKAIYLIWKDPYMTIGGDTFIHSMMKMAGLKNVFAKQQRYPIITIDDIQASNCKYLLLSSEPYPFKQKHAQELQKLCPQIKVELVDGEMFSWYGSRLLMALPYLQNLKKTLELSSLIFNI